MYVVTASLKRYSKMGQTVQTGILSPLLSDKQENIPEK